MKIRENHEIITQHALSNDDNFRVAIQVGLAFPHLKKRIIRGFLIDLAADLKQRLGHSWQVEDHWSETPLDKHGYISVRKEQWAGHSYIGLSCERSGPGKVNWYVRVDERLNAVHRSEIKAALDSSYAVGHTSGALYPWWLFCGEPFSDWDTEESLVSLRQKSVYLDHYASHLIRIASIVSPIIERIGEES